jgi:sigma-B regulation protein RsbU (phosphoserine phosphatase)
VRAGGTKAEVLETNGFPVGMLDEASFEVTELRLAPGDLVAVFSDGFEEARRAPKEFFGRERIAAVLKAHSGDSLEDIETELRAAVKEFLGGAEPHDDATLLLLRYTGNAI